MALRPSCFRKFLKNTGHFQPCPQFVLDSFSKTQGGFRAARWMLFVAGRFRLSADSRIQVSAIRVDYFEPRTQSRLVLAKFVFPQSAPRYKPLSEGTAHINPKQVRRASTHCIVKQQPVTKEPQPQTLMYAQLSKHMTPKITSSETFCRT